MMFLELFVPRGTKSPEQLRRLAEGLTMKALLTHVDAIRDVVGGDEGSGTDPGVMDFLDTITHVVVHEIGTWVVGGNVLGPAGPTRYVARVYVPGPWRKDMSAFFVAAVTRVISQADPDPERHHREPYVEVHVIGVPEGGYGMSGRVVGESALLEMISDARTGTPAPADPGVFVDPVCGMTTRDPVATLEHEGTTYGFCCLSCRRHFADRLAEAVR
ncbi:YHS domain protein [Streptosporangium sp. NPDC004379]|uniref:YHS domain protein n=1 Tax=Streptosporangium sp. NPDC004379 TaxID=3366189 RepID=UPI0036BB4AE3